MRRALFILALLVLVAPATLHAQSGWQNRRAVARPKPIPLANTPDWFKDYKFKQDKFTFVRIKYNVKEPNDGNRRRAWGRSAWATDHPDADLALCSQIEELTNLKTESLVRELTDETLPNYPFIYLSEPGQLELADAEVTALRKYLENGGFLMVDDFWGDSEWQNFYEQFKRVFPDREPTELDIKHEIFNCVYSLKEKPQVPSINSAIYGRESGITWEPYHGGDSRTVHFKAIFDDKNRMMAIICHNTDLSDGWERSAEDEWYSQEFSAKKALPMGINIVFYALTRP
ncbi:MAG TPA: DUF4159 domain-containing protein [Lacipirellulaceae bacterium]|nr:DUF4159 domain-containing protein [Lacipirellulaceae bacterium]